MNENYEDYEENLDNSEYEETKDNSSRNKKILLIVLLIIAIIIIILLLRACGKGGDSGKFDYEKTLLDAGKEYYEYNGNEIPKAKSSCTTVSLNKLISDGLIDSDKYADCNGDDTYVKVCLLENGKTHYVPILSCETIDSDNLYDKFDEGKISDIIEDETDIKYSYMGQVLKSDSATTGDTIEVWYGDSIPYDNYKLLNKVTYYRYRELQYKWYESAKLYYPNDTISGGRELYIVSPATGYNNKDNGQIAYKWYKATVGEKIYYNGYSSTAPSGYPNKDESQGYTVKSRSRTIKTTISTTKVSSTQYYKCVETASKNDPYAITSNQTVPCGAATSANPTHDYQLETFYSCDGGITRTTQSAICSYSCSAGTLRPDNSACVSYNDWTYNTEECTGASDLCENLKTPVSYYKWYKYGSETRSYYPSGSTTAAGEKTYYVNIPETGYIKDETTTTTAWNWYKEATSITANYTTQAPSVNATKSNDSKWTDWTDWSTTAVQSLGNTGTRSIETKVKLTIQEIKNVKSTNYEDIMSEYTEDVAALIKAFQDKGYEVKSLEDIAMNGEIKYLVKLYVRNKK